MRLSRMNSHRLFAECQIEREREADIGHVDTEIEHKECILLELKKNISQYQVLLDENEVLVRELQSLEVGEVYHP